MKKTLILITLLLGTLAQAQEVDTRIQHVKVYLNRAELTQEGSMSLTPGEYTLVFPGLSRHLVDNSLQVSSNSGLIQTVTTRLNYLYNRPKTPRMKQMEDSLNLLVRRQTLLTDEETVLKDEQNALLENDNIKGEEGLSLAKLRSMALLYRTRLAELQTQLSEVARRKADNQEVINRLNRELNATMEERKQPVKEVVVQYKAVENGSIRFRLRYLCEQAGWSARYDLRSEGIGFPLKFELKAEVTNNTGVDWLQIPLSLSTANPTTSAVAPDPGTWQVYVYRPQTYATGNAMTKPSAAPRMKVAEEAEMSADDSEGYGAAGGGDMPEPTSELASAFTQTMETDLSVEYDIRLKYDIPADGRTHTVSVTDHNLSASYRYYAVPKLDPGAYLQAEVTDWQGLDLLPGPANVFLGNSFVGKAYIAPGTTQDTLRLGLGQDDQVVVTRETDRSYTQRKTVGSSITESRQYKIQLRNNKTTSIPLVVEDQMPLSGHNKVEIENGQTSDAQLNDKTGRLTWKMDLAPGERKELIFGFTVKYPKDMRLGGL